MGIFKKTKKTDAEEDAIIDQISDDEDTKTPASEPAAGAASGNMEARIEKLDAQITALREVLQAQQERYERQSEELGELRSTLADREKQIRDIEAKALKAAELVAEVQPENLMSEQKKADAKIEAIKAKVENGELMSNNIVEELKKIKNSLSVFRGTEEILKLNKEMRDEYTTLKKVEAAAERHADRVEAIYTNFESNFQAFEKLKETISDIAETCDALRKDVEKNTAAITGMSKKEEVYAIKTELEKTQELFKSDKESYDKASKFIGEVAERTIKKMNDAEQKSDAFSRSIQGISEKSAELERRIDILLAVIERIAVVSLSRCR